MKNKLNRLLDESSNCFPTPGLAVKISSNCFMSAGGDIWSISAPKTAVGTLTPENCENY